MWGRLPGSARLLKISVRTSVSCAAQSFSTRPGMLSGPAAFPGLILDRSSLRRLQTDRAPGHLGGVGSFCAGVSYTDTIIYRIIYRYK